MKYFKQKGQSLAKLNMPTPLLKKIAYITGLLLVSTNLMAAISTTIVDVDGADDEPGQKDINSMTTVYDTGDGFDFHVLWSWDEISVSGNNTIDACSLYDTNGDGFANYSLCVTGGSDPISHQATTLYSCNNTRVDRCAGAVQLGIEPPDSTFSSSCSLAITATDPFHGGTDTTASCKIDLSDMGGAATAVLTNVCSYPSKEPNSDPSDCILAPTDGFLKVTKIAEDAGTQTFPVLLNNPVPPTYTSLTPLVPGEPQTIAAPADTYSLTETVPQGWEFVQMTCSLGSNTITTYPSTTPPMLEGITVAAGRITECIVVNKKSLAKLLVKKIVVNDDGGDLVANDFALSVSGNQATPSNFPGDSNGTLVTLVAGAYSVSEVENTGYKATYSTDCSGAIAAGETKTCTITNDDIAPTLKLIKIVKNDNGGTKTANDFTPSVDGIPQSWETVVTLDAGEHAVSETTLAGYAAGDWSGDCSADGKVTLGLSDNKTCTITNDDIAPTLKLIKKVVNDNGGTAVASDFTASVDGTAKNWNTAITLTAGSHTVSETNLAGYAASTWSGDCSTDGKVTLELGDNKVCTITNDDIAPTLKLIKKVVNDNGGTAIADDFTPSIDGIAKSWNTVITLNAGSHTAAETTVAGYQASAWSGDCNANGGITLAVGDSKTCTITNNDIAPTLKLIKVVVNDNGGTATASNFTPSIDGTATNWDTAVPLNVGLHTASETTLAGYKASTWSGACSADGKVTLALGEIKTCIITNDDIAPKLTLQKKIANNLYLGSQGDSADQWILIAGAVISEKGTLITADLARTNTYEVRANTSYALSESGGPTGYTASAWSCSTGGSLSGNSLTLTLGSNVTCTITNTYNRVCETAFSNGTIALKRLVKTARWGWAIELTAPTVGQTYTIFAGQTDPVGTFTVSWNGTQAQLTVKIDNDWSSEGFHLYGGDNPSTTAAPGQFNLNGATWTQIAPNTYTTTINLTDSTDRDGAWLVFHANVCEAKL